MRNCSVIFFLSIFQKNKKVFDGLCISFSTVLMLWIVFTFGITFDMGICEGRGIRRPCLGSNREISVIVWCNQLAEARKLQMCREGRPKFNFNKLVRYSANYSQITDIFSNYKMESRKNSIVKQSDILLGVHAS